MSKQPSALGTFFKELKRRKVFQVAVVYAVVGWVLIQVADTIVPRLHLPDWTPTLVIFLVIIGFPVAIILAWALELTPEGVKHTEALEGKKAEQPALVKTQPSIVVLPFDDISPGRENEYFSDGLTEEIITDLSYVHQLRVISRSSAMTFKGTNKTVKTIAQELDVQYVLEGSVRKVANDLRITAQLIDAASDAHLWAEKYSGTLDDVFDIQEKVSRSIVDALKMKLNPEEKKKIAERPIEDVQAYECYHRARQEVLRGTAEGIDRAHKLIQKGIKIIGENELLYAAMGNVYLESVNLLVVPDESQLQRVEECAKKVFNLNSNSSYGHFLSGAVHYKRGNVQKAIRYLKQAFRINPADPHTLFYLSGLLGFSGKEFAARPYAKRLLEIDPLTPLSQYWWAWVDLLGGKLQTPLEPLRNTYEMDPENPLTGWLYIMSLALNRRFDEAFTVIDRLAKVAPQSHATQQSLFLKYALQCNKSRALQAVTRDLVAAAKWDEHMSWAMADCYALINEKEKALDWLEHAALDRGFINYPFLNEYDPFLENIRGEKRFKKLMERVKYEWEHFEV